MIDRLVVLNDVSVARGGATSVALDSIRVLRKRGVPVTLIAGDAGKNSELEALGVEIIGLDQALLLDAKRSEAFLRGLFNPHTADVVGAWIADNDSPQTIYHVHTWTKVLSPSLFAALRPVSDRLIVSAHDFFLVCPNGGYVFYKSARVCTLRPMSMACIGSNCDKRNYLQKLWRVARQASRAAFLDLRRKPPLVLAVHDRMREGLERGGIPPQAIQTLRNPTRPFSNARIPAERNREALFVGRLSAEKGADIAAAAADRANIKLRIIGDGPARKALEQTYSKPSYEGHRTHSEIAEFIRTARVLIVSSRYPEPFGLVAVEAMWSGVPIVITDSALMSREIVHRGAGLSFDQKQDGALERVLRNVFDDDALTRRMSDNAFERTRDLAFSLEDWGERLVSIYQGRTRDASETPAAHETVQPRRP